MRYVGRADYWVFSFEIIFVCFVTYYMVEEVMELRKVKLDYFNSAWNVMDLVVILISVSNIIMALYTEIIVTDLLKVLQILNGKVPSGRMQEALTLKILFCILAPSC